MYEMKLSYSMTMAKQSVPKEILKKILVQLPCNTLWQQRLLCKGAYIAATELLMTPEVYRHAIISPLSTWPEQSSASKDENQRVASNSMIRNFGPIRDFGQLSSSDNPYLNQCYAISDLDDIALYRLSNTTLIKIAEFKAIEPIVNQMIIGLDQKTIAVGYDSGKIRVFNYDCMSGYKKPSKLKKGLKKLANKLTRNKKQPSYEPQWHDGHNTRITAMRAINDKNFLSADQSGKILLWQADDLSPIKEWQVDAPVHAVTHYIGGALLYLTSTYNPKRFEQVFSVIQLDHTQQQLLYSHVCEADDKLMHFRSYLSKSFFSFIREHRTSSTMTTVDTHNNVQSEDRSAHGGYKFTFFTAGGKWGVAKQHDSSPSTTLTLQH